MAISGKGAAIGAGSGALAGSIIPGVGTLTGGAIGALLGLFSGNDKNQGGGNPINFLDVRNPDQKRIDASFADFISKNLPGFTPGEPFTGERVAPISGFEGQGLEFLQQFLNAPDKTELLGAAKKQVLDTLGGEFDPLKSEKFRALRELAEQQRQEGFEAINRQTAGRNNFFSSERIREIGDVAQNTTNALNFALAELASDERDRQIEVLNDALAIDADFTKAPLKKVAAALSFGALPRALNQAELEAVYQDFLRIREEKSLPATLAAGGTSNQRLLTVANQPTQGGSAFLDFLGPILQSSATQATKTILTK